MRTLNWYVTRGFLLSFCMAIVVLTFVMTGANLVQAMDFLSRGVPFSLFLEFTLSLMPRVLTFTIPWAVLVGVMLVFGRLSADSEITAMRACGVSLLQIMSPILIITFALTCLCLYLQVEVGPPLLGHSRELATETMLDTPEALFEPGRPLMYDNAAISIMDKTEDGTLIGVQIYQMDKRGAMALDISAATAKLRVDHEQRRLMIRLYDCLLVDKKSKPELRNAHAEMEFGFDYGKELNRIRLGVRPKYMRLKDLMAYIKLERMMNHSTIKEEIELNQRIAFALAPMAFLLLGMPLAIRASRKETSVGLFLSVLLAGGFCQTIIICKSLENIPQIYPQYLLWLPNILFQVGGAIMIYRISQK
ncbi:MAG: LptF/LptG family permease [Lentisphaeria bacterium]|nr:LptF/LptG family permease [Lentisphaeria bacterium]